MVFKAMSMHIIAPCLKYEFLSVHDGRMDQRTSIQKLPADLVITICDHAIREYKLIIHVDVIHIGTYKNMIRVIQHKIVLKLQTLRQADIVGIKTGDNI